MIEIDWDKIRENTLKLVCGYRDTYAGKEWKCRELQEKWIDTNRNRTNI